MISSGPIVVLNVDDQDTERYIKTRDLRQGGFEVVEASTGAEALRLVEAIRPAVVLLDVQLPDINGFQVCTFIKRKWPEVMVLQTSATFTTAAHRTAGLDAGADSYLVQPSEPLELAAAVNALVRIRNSEDALRSLNATLEQRVEDRLKELAETNAKLTAEISQRKKAEAALIQSQKMEAVGQLTGGLAHDFNNLLTAVVGNLDLIRNRAADTRIIRWSENAFNAAQRGSKLTAQLLAFSRTQKFTTSPVDINALLDGMRELLSQSLGANITVQFDLYPTSAIAMADANQLELAILNLAINARDAMPEGGTLSITTSLVEDDTVIVSVTDTGSGMPPDVAARAFDPFFTTKPPGKGTGLGLSQVYGIIRQFDGDVTIQTAPGQGTTFRLQLPRTTDDVRVESQIGALQAGRHTEKLLVVDDDADVREIIVTVLSDIGYAVHEATDADEALRLLRQIEPELLIVDFAMPGRNGAEFAKAARATRPSLKILFASGYADTAALEAAVGENALLRKPFRPAELAAAVRIAIDGA